MRGGGAKQKGILPEKRGDRVYEKVFLCDKGGGGGSKDPNFSLG